MELSERPAKKPRGSYAKLICLSCRERRIKCKIPHDGSVQPSPDPQPPERACERCKQQGLDCIVRKTTLGRPSQKKSPLPTPASTSTNTGETYRSPSPEAEDFVLLKIDRQRSNKSRHHTISSRPTSAQLLSAIEKNFDLTSGLLARDPRFGSAIMESRDTKPLALDEVLSRDLAEVLETLLVWQHIYIPWLPRLTTLYDEAISPNPEGGSSTVFLTALLASIALDTPSERITKTQRQIRSDLQSIIYHAGQKVLFTLPRHVNTVSALVLVHGYRPLALIHSQQAAAHTLSGRLYPTLIAAVQQQLGIDLAPARLRECLEGRREDNVPKLVSETLQWCSTLTFRLNQELEEIGAEIEGVMGSELELKENFYTVAWAIERGLAGSESIFIFHVVRYHADYILAMRDLTANWTDLPKLSEIISEYEGLCHSRRSSFDRDLRTFFIDQGKTEEALALAQLSKMELNQGQTTLYGLAMVYAIVYGAQKMIAANKPDDHEMVNFNKYYTDALHHEAGMPLENKSEPRKLLDKYGDVHMDGLERRLTDFINAATEVQLQGIPFIGPTRHTTSNVLMACKEIVENNAVRIKLDGELHSRVDMQLILFQEAARRLEGMEADGDTPEAVNRGSVIAGSAKLIRGLHRILSRWKRSYVSKQHQWPQISEQTVTSGPSLSSAPEAGAQTILEPVDPMFQDDYIGIWDNWPQLDLADFSNPFPFGIDSSAL